MEYGEGIVKMGSFYGHGGELFGFNSVMWYLPQSDATIVINVNRTNEGGEPLADLSHGASLRSSSRSTLAIAGKGKFMTFPDHRL